MIKDILAKNSDEQIWDSEELIMTDSENRLEVDQPPNLELLSFTSDRIDIGEGQAVTFTIIVSNNGEADAKGDIVLKQGAAELGRVYFTVSGLEMSTVTYEYSVPGTYNGE